MNDNEVKDKLLAGLIAPWAILAAVIVATPFALWQAYVGSSLWHWFAVPLGLPSINIWDFWGLTMLLGILIPSHDDNDSGKKVVTKVAIKAIGLLLILGIGYLIRGRV